LPILAKVDPFGAVSRYNKQIPFPARCGVAWSATKICVFVNLELPTELPKEKVTYANFVKYSNMVPV